MLSIVHYKVSIQWVSIAPGSVGHGALLPYNLRYGSAVAQTESVSAPDMRVWNLQFPKEAILKAHLWLSMPEMAISEKSNVMFTNMSSCQVSHLAHLAAHYLGETFKLNPL